MSHVIAVFGASSLAPSDDSYLTGVAIGAGLATAGFTVATGGYGGSMEAVSKGASEAGGRVIGVTAPELFPDRSGANGYVHDELHRTTIATRIAALVDQADGYVVLPGSLGTATELMVAWNDVYLASISGRPVKPCIVLDPSWKPLVELLADRYGADPSPVQWARSADESIALMKSAFGLA